MKHRLAIGTVVVVLITLVVTIIVVTKSTREKCTTPTGKPGVCSLLYECPKLLRKVHDVHRNRFFVNFVLNSKCDRMTDRNEPTVCCESSFGSRTEAQNDVSEVDNDSASRQIQKDRSNIKDCDAYDGSKGECVPHESCGSIKSIIDGPRPLTNESMNIIKKSICSEDGFSVCCKNVEPTTLLPETCGADEDDDKIYGGTEASIYQFPWLVQIESYRNSVKVPICGGSLITSLYVITAAHCLRNEYEVESVKIGEHNLTTLIDCQKTYGVDDCNEPFLRIFIDDVFRHPEYMNKNPVYDIAVIKLEKKVPFTDFMSPICLPTYDVTLNISQDKPLKFLVAGWGATIDSHRSDVKQFVQVPYVHIRDCDNRNLKLNDLKENDVICAGGEEGKDSCSGDSGGPLMYQTEKGKILVGVVSEGPFPCGEEGRAGVYTNVFMHMPWILSQLKP